MLGNGVTPNICTSCVPWTVVILVSGGSPVELVVPFLLSNNSNSTIKNLSESDVTFTKKSLMSIGLDKNSVTILL